MSGGTKALRELRDDPSNAPYLGQLLVPGAGNRVPRGDVFAADNAAFSGFNAALFCSLLGRLRGSSPLWVAAPDVVGDARSTLGRFERWQPVIAECGLPSALVLQDGVEETEIPWDRFDAVFVGGSTEFKLSAAAADVVAEAKRRLKLTHMGRVNTRKRIEHAVRVGCDTVDGSGFSRWSSIRVPMYLRWVKEILGVGK